MNATLSPASVAVPEQRLPWYARLVLLRPARIRANLERVREAAVVPRVPNSWQVFLGVLRMIYRLVFHGEAVGQSETVPLRRGWRVGLLQWRPLRLPFLLIEGSVVPLDLSGLASSPERLMTHLLGTYHAGEQFVYDLRLLQIHPGKLEELRLRSQRVIEQDSRRFRWLRDLCIYEGYHETLLAAVERALADDYSFQACAHTDTGLHGYLSWCASTPPKPGAAWSAWRRGELDFDEVAPGEEVPTAEPTP